MRSLLIIVTVALLAPTAALPCSPVDFGQQLLFPDVLPADGAEGVSTEAVLTLLENTTRGFAHLEARLTVTVTGPEGEVPGRLEAGPRVGSGLWRPDAPFAPETTYEMVLRLSDAPQPREVVVFTTGEVGPPEASMLTLGRTFATPTSSHSWASVWGNSTPVEAANKSWSDSSSASVSKAS